MAGSTIFTTGDTPKSPAGLMPAILLAPVMLLSHSLRLLGLPALGRVGAGLGSLLYYCHFRRSIVEGNLRLAYGEALSGPERTRLTRDIFRQLGRTFLEIARNFSLTQSQMRQELILSPEVRHGITTALARRRGIVFVSAHLGNWELLAMGMAAHGFPANIVVKKQSSPISQALIERQRRRTGLEVIYAGGTVEKMRVALRQGKVIGFMMDQNTTGQKGIRCHFFGVPASSIRALGKLIRETEAAVLPICVFREPDGRQRVHLFPELPCLTADDLPAGSEARALREEWLNAQQYQAAIEAMIRLHPEQWLWIHRRWKARRDPLPAETAHLENLVP